MVQIAHECRVCGTELNDENWYPSQRRINSRICKECNTEQTNAWRKANQDKARVQSERGNRKRGQSSFNENKECASYLGIHVAERVLSQVFKNVIRMPMNNQGYDIICNHGKLIDIKSSCILFRIVDGIKYSRWMFTINHNTTADYFLCLAFDNREALKPLHAWLIPGSKINHLKNTSVSPSTINKWDEYALDISKISDCCDAMR